MLGPSHTHNGSRELLYEKGRCDFTIVRLTLQLSCCESVAAVGGAKVPNLLKTNPQDSKLGPISPTIKNSFSQPTLRDKHKGGLHSRPVSIIIEQIAITKHCNSLQAFTAGVTHSLAFIELVSHSSP